MGDYSELVGRLSVEVGEWNMARQRASDLGKPAGAMECVKASALIRDARDAIQTLQASQAVLLAALSFYADDIAYECGSGDVVITDYPVFADGGKIARNAIAQAKGE